MKKDESILRSSLSTLLKRFSNTDVISNIEKEYSHSIAGQVKLSLIDDNHILKKAHINEKQINDLMESIKEKGITSPFLVIANNDRYEIVISRSTYIAARKLHLDSVPIALLNIEEEEMLMFLASHLRDTKNSSIIEMSLVLNHLVKKYKYSQKEIASLMHLSRSQITNIIRLNKMPEWVLIDMANAKLSPGHVRAISTLKEEEMRIIVDRIYSENLSVREVEKLVYEMKNDIDYEKVEKSLNRKLKCKSNVTHKRVVLVFDSEKAQSKFLEKMKEYK